VFPNSIGFFMPEMSIDTVSAAETAVFMFMVRTWLVAETLVPSADRSEPSAIVQLSTARVPVRS